MSDTAADAEGQETAGMSVDEQLLHGLPTPVARIIRLLTQRGIPSYVNVSGGPVLVPLVDCGIIFVMSKSLDSIGFRSLWSRGFSSARYRDAVSVCADWNRSVGYLKAYATEPSLEQNQAVRIVGVGQIMCDGRDEVLGQRLDDSIYLVQNLYAWVNEQCPDPIRIPNAPYGRGA